MLKTYRKSKSDAQVGFFESEVAGLKWLKVLEGPRIVEVVNWNTNYLELELINTVAPTQSASYQFGQQLATLHSIKLSSFGQSPSAHLFFGPLSDAVALPIEPTTDFVYYWYNLRMLPMLDEGVRRGCLRYEDIKAIEQLAHQISRSSNSQWLEVPPSKVHGDLWNGNLLWTLTNAGVQAVLIDPCAHSGHYEEDLAMLELFGCPYFSDILDGYNSIRPLLDGYQARFALHNLFPIASHVVFFGKMYYNQFRNLVVQANEYLNQSQ